MQSDLETTARARSVSDHFLAVKEMAAKAGNPTPSEPTVPDDKLRETCARLILEEALEAIGALGFTIFHDRGLDIVDIYSFKGGYTKLVGDVLATEDTERLVNIAHECADLRVVATFTMAVSGISDESVQNAVDEANLAKFGPGGYKDATTGKWIKPPDHKKPDIESIIHWQKEG